jgi:hypothetical protein
MGEEKKLSFFFLEILEFTDNAFSLDSGLHAWLANWAIDQLVVYALQ